MIWDFLWPFGFVGVVGLVLLPKVARLWKADLAALEQKRFRSGTFYRGSVAAAPVLLAWCWLSAIVGVLIAIDSDSAPVPLAVVLGAGALWFGLSLVCIAAAYYGRPRLALLPALRSDESYARFTRGP